MPSTLTHYLFNKQLIKDDKYKNIFLLAGQGPDTFFFYGYNFLKRENVKEIQNIGRILHQINPDELYFKMLKYCFNKEENEKEILINFTKGFIYHYILDRTIHPYVFYNSGFPYTNKFYSLKHTNFESIMDTLLMKRYNEKTSTRQCLKAKKEEILLCSKMLKEVINEILNCKYLKDDSYYKAYKDYRFVRLCVDSRWGIKKGIFNLFLKNTSINAISQPRKVKDDIKYDYLNLNHATWLTPCKGEKKNSSIIDLFEDAKLDCRIIDNIIYNFKDNIATKTKIAKFCNNLNHDGKDLDQYMIYFKIIWNR